MGNWEGVEISQYIVVPHCRETWISSRENLNVPQSKACLFLHSWFYTKGFRLGLLVSCIMQC